MKLRYILSAAGLVGILVLAYFVPSWCAALQDKQTLEQPSLSQVALEDFSRSPSDPKELLSFFSGIPYTAVHTYTNPLKSGGTEEPDIGSDIQGEPADTADRSNEDYTATLEILESCLDQWEACGMVLLELRALTKQAQLTRISAYTLVSTQGTLNLLFLRLDGANSVMDFILDAQHQVLFYAAFYGDAELVEILQEAVATNAFDPANFQPEQYLNAPAPYLIDWTGGVGLYEEIDCGGHVAYVRRNIATRMDPFTGKYLIGVQTSIDELWAYIDYEDIGFVEQYLDE